MNNYFGCLLTRGFLILWPNLFYCLYLKNAAPLVLELGIEGFVHLRTSSTLFESYPNWLTGFGFEWVSYIAPYSRSEGTGVIILIGFQAREGLNLLIFHLVC